MACLREARLMDSRDSRRAGEQTHVHTGVGSDISLGCQLFPSTPSSGPHTCLVIPKTKTQ